MRQIYILFILILSLSAFEDLTSKSNQTKPKEYELLDIKSIQKAFFKESITDAIITYKYNQNEVMKIRTRVFVETNIILPDNEIVLTYSVGEASKGFIVRELIKGGKNFKNILVIKPIYEGIDTSLIVYGSSGKIYNFYVYSTGVKSALVPHMSIYVSEDGKLPTPSIVQDKSGDELIILELKDRLEKNERDYKNRQYKDVTAINIANMEIDYKLTKKEESQKLEGVFNDDKFTYFKFKDDYIIPRIYYFDEFDRQKKVEFSITDNVIQVKRVAKRWLVEINSEIKTVVEKVGEFRDLVSSKELIVNLTLISFDKKVVNDEKLGIEAIFSDDKATYFKFNLQKSRTFPVVYRVIDGYDNPASTEISGEYIIAKIIHDGFTLRLGKKHSCIRNKNARERKWYFLWLFKGSV